MGKSQMVRARDVARLIRLANELDEVSSDRGARMQHVAQSAARLFNAKLGAIGFGDGFLPRGQPRFTCSIGGGWLEASEQAAFVRYLAGDLAVDPCIPLMARNLRPLFTVRRRQLVDDRTWYATPHVADDRKKAGVDDVVYSFQRLNKTGSVQAIAIHRPWNDAIMFTDEDRVLLRLLHMAVSRKVNIAPRQTRPARLARELSPRLRQTLERLLLGESEKQIAAAFGLSRHTVHGYIKSIYSHFDAANRGELLAQWVELDDESV
jgi:DNA-binding CsgD family transcriptional regulator